MIRYNAKLLAAVAIAQSNEESRYYLCGVHFENNGIAVATNGHILTCAKDETATIGETGIFPISKKALTAMRKLTAEYVTIADGLLTVREIDGEHAEGEALHIEPCKPIDGTFPDWRRVVPSECRTVDAGAAWVSTIDHAKMTETAKALYGAPASKHSLGGSCYVVSGDPSGPNLVQYSGDLADSAFSVVMPMRGGYVRTKRPEWVGDYPATAEASRAAE